ncbi:LOW QUALITY PROTEIN: glycine betaine transporter OpuD [Geomicrobium sp. JCM 19055]|nr:LOW QUALITY PROTEIN: glycine betaine transporter OpuD [Geomicrobium sp. JCM 19055]
MKRLTPVFYISVVVAALFILWGSIGTEHMMDTLSSLQAAISTQLGWYYMLTASAFVLLSIFLVVSPFGRIRLGKPDERPEYNYFTWFAFLFTAGMGIGLVFWGAAEPLNHYYNPATVEGETSRAAAEALQYSFFHWGFHPWAIYSVVALALAYFGFRHNAPGVVSAAFRPLIGDKADGWIGTLINFIVVFATIFGVATSLGLGTAQVGAGLSQLFPVQNSTTLQLWIIAVVTVIYIASAATGINKGIKILSMANIVLAFALLLFVLVVGPTVMSLSAFTQTVGSYLQNLPYMSFRLAAFDDETATSWVNDWTLFYWAWWISWAPFVGTFIARVSRGRTIREFVLGVILAPTAVSALWFATFGTAAMELDNQTGGAIFSMISDPANGEEMALFALLEQYPLATIMTGLSVLLIASFFVTSADSATFVLGMQTTGGRMNPPISVKAVWGIIQSAAAAILLLAGGLDALQTAAIIAALPFSVIMILMTVSLIKSLIQERKAIDQKEARNRKEMNEELKLIKEEREQLRKERKRSREQEKARKKEEQQQKRKQTTDSKTTNPQNKDDNQNN